MRAEKVIHDLMAADPGLAALVSTRIYPGRLPQQTPMPAISYEFVSGSEILPINAQAGGALMKSRVQVTALAKSYSDCKAVLEAVRKAVLYQRGRISGVQVISITRDTVGPDLRDDELGLYLQGVDYVVVHDEN